MSFAALLRREPCAVAFGLLHTVAATIGQTFVISLFLPGIKEGFSLSDAQVSLLFTGTTLASAAALWKIGPWIDRADVVTGRIVDRTGSAWLFCVHLLPLAVGAVALIRLTSPWVVPLFWLCAGVTVGMGTVLQTTVIAERVPVERLGSARSWLAAGTIVASAVGPSLYGAGLAAGASMPTLLWASVAVLVGTTVLGVVATRSTAAGC